MKNWSAVLLGVLTMLLSAGTTFSAFAQETPQYGVPAPTILQVRTDSPEFAQRPLVQGVTFNKTTVDVYFNGELLGRALVKDDQSGVASFAFQPHKALVAGQYNITAVARSIDQTVQSIASAPADIDLDDLLTSTPLATPAPVLVEPVVSNGALTVVGLAKNHLAVEIFINGRSHVTFTPPTASSGTTNFWYRPNLPIGEYEVTARTINPDGTMSPLTPVLPFVVTAESAPHVVTNQSDATDASTTDETPVTEPEDTQNQDTTQTETNTPVVEDTTDTTDVVVDFPTNTENEVIVSEPETDDTIVVGQNTDDQTDDTIAVSDGSTIEDENIDEGEIAEGVSEQADDTQDREQRNRLTGFIILLAIAVILAIWYVREKKAAEEAAALSDQSTDSGDTTKSTESDNNDQKKV